MTNGFDPSCLNEPEETITFDTIVQDIRSDSGVLGLLVTNKDGLIMGSSMEHDFDLERIGQVCIGAIAHAIEEFHAIAQLDRPDWIHTRTTQGWEIYIKRFVPSDTWCVVLSNSANILSEQVLTKIDSLVEQKLTPFL